MLYNRALDSTINDLGPLIAEMTTRILLLSMRRPGLLGAAFVLCSAVIAYTLVERPNPFDKATFDAQRWLASTSNEGDAACYRGEMAEDIRHSVLSKGMT